MHTLSRIIVRLVIARHNKISDKLLYLSRRSFNSESVLSEPLIHQGCTRSEQDIRQGNDNHQDTRWDMMVRGLWYRQVDAIIDVKLVDADTYTYKYKPMTSLLSRWENIKKDKHSKHCHNQRKHFSPFVFSVDRIQGREALFMLS